MRISAQHDELGELLIALTDGAIDRRHFGRLQSLLSRDADAQNYFRRYMRLCALLEFERAAVEGEQPEIGESGAEALCGPPGFHGLESPRQLYKKSLLSNQPFSPLSTLHPPLSTLHSSLSPTFVGGPVFSYMVALVIVGMMLLGAWTYKITHYRQIVDNRPPSVNRPEMQFVGRITGMVDCRWSDPRTEAYHRSYVPLGRKYALLSGLMEITYDSGAKVILQGPCTYEVESRAGGYLALGKLTAKIEERGEGRGERERLKDEGRSMKFAAVAKPQAANPQISKSPNLQIPNRSPLSSLLSPLFAVRTPAALITDLGTEFGVEVAENGDTSSHVFRGSIKVQTVGDGRQKEVVLRANESARVEKGKKAGDARIVTSGQVGAPPKFVRRMVEPPKLLDLLDIVAGGNGTGRRRERGIDPIRGMEDPLFVWYAGGDRRYWPVAWHKLIDGVFVPDGRDGAIQIDSAGHSFDGFPATTGKAYGSIWARAVEIEPDKRAAPERHWIYIMGRGEQFMPKGRGLLGLHPNTGITFDLEAMRRAHPGSVPSRFQAVAGLVDAHSLFPDAVAGLADIWVFVDGKLRLKHTQLRPQDGALNVDVKLDPSNQFLALASTDGGNGYANDWVVFGDPVIEIVPIE